MTEPWHDNKKITVVIDPDLEDLIPGYLISRQIDISLLHKALQEGDYGLFKLLGHRMKGTGAGYGFDAISEIGAALEKAGLTKNPEEAQLWIERLALYLAKVEWQTKLDT